MMDWANVRMKKIALAQAKGQWQVCIVYCSDHSDSVAYLPNKLVALAYMYGMCELHRQKLPATPHKGKQADIYYFK